ncbi:MAG: class I SAM-dependent methyltransferase [Planctomycetes bacterium]|nr:class I SAM-dependent methyltransferase [Planctomycetota bacterium]
MNHFEEAYYNAASLWSGTAVQDPANMQRVRETAALLPSTVTSLLDAGCGNGVFLHFVRRARPDIELTGLDRSLQALQHVRTRKQHGSVDDIPFGGNSFDCVSCLQVLEHLPVGAYENALKELARVGRTFVLVSVPYREKTEDNMTECPQCRSVFNVDLHLRRFDESIIEGLLAEYGFRHVSSICPLRHLRYAGTERFAAIRQRVSNSLRKRRRSFMSPICPICGHTEGDRTALSTSQTADQRSVTLSRGVSGRILRRTKLLLKPFWPKRHASGYWIVALYERDKRKGGVSQTC